MDFEYTYTGPIYAETRKFSFQRSNVLSSVFAADDWNSVIKIRGRPVSAILDREIPNTITKKTVKIDIGAGNDKVVLKGGVYTNPHATGNLVILFLSGSAGPINRYSWPVVEKYLAGDARISALVKSVVCIDYRGFGLSRHVAAGTDDYLPTGNYMPGSKAVYTDASAMIEFITAARDAGGLGVDGGKLVLHGFSLGSGPASEMAKIGAAHGGLILHGPMKSVYYEAKGALSFGLQTIGGLVARGNVGFENISKMQHVSVPVLVTTGPNDSMWKGANALWKKLVKHHKNVRMAVHDGDHLHTYAIFQKEVSDHDQTKYGTKSAFEQLEDFLKEVEGK